VVSETEARQYTATTFPRDPYQGCERMIRMAQAVGYLTEATSGAPHPYAVLDVLAEDGDIVQDFLIPHARAWGTRPSAIGVCRCLPSRRVPGWSWRS
jgi:hypothetical protein